MSLLRRTPSLSDSIDHEDDIPSQTSGWSKLLDGQDDNDGFMTDDDDDLSFDGIYDDQPDAPPHYQSSPPDVDSLHRRLGALTMGPNKVPVKGRFPRSQPYYPGIDICIVCQERPPFSKNGQSYPTCGLTCAGILSAALNKNGNNRNNNNGSTHASPKRMSRRRPSNVSFGKTQSSSPSAVRGQRPSASGSSYANLSPRNNTSIAKSCVVCRNRSCHGEYVTCGLRCAEQLCLSGSSDPTKCNYCHRRPKLSGHNQCGQTCADAAKVACLLCKSRPKYKRFHLCGKSCKLLSTKVTPLLLEAPEGHATWDLVQKKFDSAWKHGVKPAIKKIYKIIESNSFLQPYDQYKKRIGRRTEVFRYHGTSRRCTLGSNGNTKLCLDTGCALCSILKTSFKTSLANPGGAFGAGIYSSSAANKAYSYSNNGNGAMILTKVVLGKVYGVNNFAVVSSCPAGYDSVVFDRQQGSLNETIVYSDDAIRPVFLIIFK